MRKLPNTEPDEENGKNQSDDCICGAWNGKDDKQQYQAAYLHGSFFWGCPQDFPNNEPAEEGKQEQPSNAASHMDTKPFLFVFIRFSVCYFYRSFLGGSAKIVKNEHFVGPVGNDFGFRKIETTSNNTANYRDSFADIDKSFAS